MAFCISDKFKSVYTCVEAFEFIRSTKGGQNPFQKRDLLKLLGRTNRTFEQMSKTKSAPHVNLCKKCAEYGYTNRLA